MKKDFDQAEKLRAEAISYAAEILQGFAEGQEQPKIAVMLDALADEYDLAQKEKRGMDPMLVKLVVQKLIDIATFPDNNMPAIYNPEQTGDTMLFEAPMFRYVRQKGRPKNPDVTARIAYTVSAVAACFGLKLYQNDEPSSSKKQPLAISACAVVAEANTILRLPPSSYRGVRACLERGNRSELDWLDGEARGTFDRKMRIKLATTGEG